MTSKRERERGRFASEARRALGIRAQASEVSHVVEVPPSVAIDMERRLAAKHDPLVPSACRLCGISLPGVEPLPSDGSGLGMAGRGEAGPGTAGRGRAGLGGARLGRARLGPSGSGGSGAVEQPWTEVGGWKTCPACQLLLPGGLGALLSALIGQTVEATEAVDVLDRMGANSPCYFWDRWPSDPGRERRFEHVRADFAERGRAALADLRAESQLRRSSSGRGCAWCGIRSSVRWTESPWRWGRARDAQRASLCAVCVPLVRRSGAYGGSADWRPFLLAAITGMRRPSWGYDLGVRAFFESAPDDPSGTETPWAYLGPTRDRLRMAVLHDHPRLVEPTERERRVLALQAMAGAERPPTPRLANVD